MKSFIYLTLLLLISCVNNNPNVSAKSMLISDNKLLVQSFKKWISLNKTGNYSYNVFVSSFSGYQSNTKIIVKNNKVIAREFSSMGLAPKLVEWKETAGKLGSHKSGASLKLMERLYRECAKILKADKSKNNLTLTFDKSGLLNYCVSAPKGCMDDCSSGVKISSISMQ